MINSYSDKDQTVAVDGGVVFNNDVIKTGCTVAHSEGTSVFTLIKPGYYYVSLNLTGAPSAAGDVSFQLYNGINPIPGTVVTETSTGLDDVVNLTINTIIQVKPSCCMVNNNVSLVVTNIGAEATISNAAIAITKIA